MRNCFSKITGLLDNNLHDADLQYKIEKVLSDADREWLTRDLYGISFSKPASKWFFGKRVAVLEYLAKIVPDLSELRLGKNRLSNNVFYTAKIVKTLTPEVLVNVLMSFFLWIVTMHSKGSIPSLMEATNHLSRKLVQLYIQTLYRQHKRSTKDPLTLSEWKQNNQDKISFLNDDPTTLTGIAGNLIQYLLTERINLVEQHSEYGVDKKLVQYLRLTGDSKEFMVNSGTNSFSNPTNLPMIVKPKAYTLSPEGVISYGGYLGNNDLTDEPLFIPRVGYKEGTTLNKKNSIIDMINGLSSVSYKINVDTLNLWCSEKYYN